MNFVDSNQNALFSNENLRERLKMTVDLSTKTKQQHDYVDIS